MVKLKQGESIIQIYSDSDIYKEFIGKLIKLEKYKEDTIYFYTKLNYRNSASVFPIWQNSISYILFDNNTKVINYNKSVGVTMFRLIRGMSNNKEDLFYHTNNKDFAKMLLTSGGLI